MDATEPGPAPDGAEEERLLVGPDDYLVDCFRLARRIWDDGYRPDFLIGLWRGGTPPGIVIQEFFRWKGLDPYHTAIRTQSMAGVRHGDGFDIKGFEHVIDVVDAEDRMLVIDDLFETGRTIHEVVEFLRRKARRNTPEVRVAVVWYRRHRRRFAREPDYWLREVRARPVSPYRLTAMSAAEIRGLDPEIAELLYPGAADADGS